MDNELTEEQSHRLGTIAAEAALVRELLQHPGMAVMRRIVDKKTEVNQKKWYDAKTPEEAEDIRIKTRGYEEFFSQCKIVIANGLAAEKMLNPPSEKE